ncbi:uncharacterized protein [Tursiops truncatus]|uniref:Uncharacterized protein LOC109552438 n=1 Tax=Tursiops truncatus TaxID=9739 RepID=A0A2U4CHC8_TURTR|nr:uncharacterized protein LOC109552438 [Tursiops truncatus]XP_019804842.2 uncharacterized protein LOC109552438 [Tursiops truncatus]XP_033714495.1 uncharacterized protein LOC109552438 [Tursiops truncatus]XP_033714497.1 uncharacterized protein LOC109552438 [Tursiops truncatus]XP_033714498.1 uncharacterized protein LOC109552438 [Tursiops truncatus]XP_033714499.1 uncharacterized protein LOC109552438 [Tursiops truncatus]XP_033714500.1 uncharacterized protein LOC109552438 [Tursiops truncatus]
MPASSPPPTPQLFALSSQVSPEMAPGEATSDPWVISSTCPASGLHLTSCLPPVSSGSPPSGCFYSSYFLTTLPLPPVLNVGAHGPRSLGELSHHDHRGDVQTCTPALASLLTHRANRLLVSWCLRWDTLLAPQTQHIRIGAPNETSSWAAHLGDITISLQPGVKSEHPVDASLFSCVLHSCCERGTGSYHFYLLQTTVPFQVLTRMPPAFDSPGGLRCPFSCGPSGAYTGTVEKWKEKKRKEKRKEKKKKKWTGSLEDHLGGAWRTNSQSYSEFLGAIAAGRHPLWPQVSSASCACARVPQTRCVL